MSQWDYKIGQPMPGPFPSPIQEKALGSRLNIRLVTRLSVCHKVDNTSHEAVTILNIIPQPHIVESEISVCTT